MDQETAVQFATVAFAVVGAFSTVAAITPNKSDDEIVQFVLSFINALGANVGNAKNK